jgi:hypothetical protein
LRPDALTKVKVFYNSAFTLKPPSEKIFLFKANSTFHALLHPMILCHSSASSGDGGLVEGNEEARRSLRKPQLVININAKAAI